MDELLLTDEEILDLGKKYCYQSTRPAIATWELCWMKEICQSQLLKCHQSEAARIKVLNQQHDTELDNLKIRQTDKLSAYEARIKELEHKEVWLTEHCNKIDQQHKDKIAFLQNEIIDKNADIEELKLLNQNNDKAIRAEYEARIKELEIQTQSCGDCDKDIRADERRKVRQDLKDYICEECSTPNFIHVVIPLKIWEEWQK